MDHVYAARGDLRVCSLACTYSYVCVCLYMCLQCVCLCGCMCERILCVCMQCCVLCARVFVYRCVINCREEREQLKRKSAKAKIASARFTSDPLKSK